MRREAYTGSWLPEPLVEEDAGRRVEDEEAVSLAFLVLLERLNPDERAVLVLRESFDYEFSDIAEILDIAEANARQILSRARRRIDDERPRFDPDPRERGRLVARFLAAARDGDMDGLVALLAPDAVMVGDGGGKARAIAAPMHGAARIARALIAFYRMSRGVGRHASSRRSSTASPASAPSRPTAGSSTSSSLDVEGGVVTRLHSIVNPDKLGHLGPLSDLGAAPGAGNPTGMTPATPRAGRLRSGDIAPMLNTPLHQLPPRDGSLQPRRRCPRGPRPAADLAW